MNVLSVSGYCVVLYVLAASLLLFLTVVVYKTVKYVRYYKKLGKGDYDEKR